MKDYRTHLETLRQQAAEAALISAQTTVQHKRELFAKHAQHLDALLS
jgi:peroxiredoxin